MLVDPLTAFGVLSVTGMLVFYALEERSLWFVMALHAAWNFTQGALLGIPVSGFHVDGLMTSSTSGPELLSGGAFGAEASVLTVVICTSLGLWFAVKAVKDGRIVRPAWSRKDAAPAD